MALLVVLLLLIAGPVHAVNYTWTNTQSDASGSWTNGVLWNSTVSAFPGSGAGDSAFLTNQFSGTYTNLLNSSLASSLTALTISNGLGEAWLVVTNGTSSTTITASTFTLGAGGRLQVDAGGLFNTTSFNWLGNNGAIYLNSGGRLSSAAGVTIGGAVSGVSGLVTSSSGAGNGGVWNLNNNALTIGGGNNNVLTINGGAILTNVNSLTMNGSSNSLVIGAGSKLFGSGAITYSTSGSNNTITMSGGLWNLAGNNFYLGAASNTANNAFYSYGGTVTNVANFFVGGNPGNPSAFNDNNTVIFTNGGGFFMRDAANFLSIGGSYNQQFGGNNNTVILSNSYLRGGASSANIGSGSTNNVLTLLPNAVWNNDGQAIYVGGWERYAGSNNLLHVNGGMITNAGVLGVGASGISSMPSFNQLIVDNGGVISNFTGGLTVGNGPGSTFNKVVATNGGRLFMTGGAIAIGGSPGGGVGGNNNTVIASNSTFKSTSATLIGVGSSNNTFTLLDNSTWDNGNTALIVGTGQALNNILTLSGTTITNVGALYIGSSLFGGNAAAAGNQLIAMNGGIISNVGTVLLVGSGYGNSVVGSDNNKLIVTNSGSGLFMTRQGFIEVGANYNQAPGGNNNTVILSNSVLWGGNDGIIGVNPSNIGNGSTNNTVTLLANTVWNNGGQGLNIGGCNSLAGGVSNVLTVNSALLTNFGAVQIGALSGGLGNRLIVVNGGILSNFNGLTVGASSGSTFNSLVATNGGRLFMSSGTIAVGSTVNGAAGGNNNSVVLSDSVLNSSGTAYIGSASSNNSLTLLANTLWNNGGLDVRIGGSLAGSFNNVLTVNGGILSNVGTIYMNLFGNSQSAMLIVSNGGVVKMNGYLSIGNDTSSNSAVVVTGAGSVISNASTSAHIIVGSSNNNGSDNSSSNRLTISAGGKVFDAGASFIGGFQTGHNSNNAALVTGPGSMWQAGSLTVGSSTSAGNSLLVSNGGLMEVGLGGLVTGTASGNTISNVGGVFQFTFFNPTITAGSGRGSIAINSGTISFRGINNADVYASVPTIPATGDGGELVNMVFAGTNTFMLNASTNLTTGQSYTFQVVSGNPSNWANLVMINGATTYRGGDLTIGATGSLLITNTTASITGLFTNNGLTRVTIANATFSNVIVNAGTLALQAGTVSGNLSNLAGGLLQGNGTVFGSVTNLGTISPGFSVGSLTITGNLSLAGSSLMVMELFGAGSNDLVAVGQKFTYGGTLTVTNADGFGYAAGQSFQLFTFGSQGGDFTTTNLPVLTGLAWDTTQLDSLGVLSIVVVPEPSTFLLLAGASLLFISFRRRPC